MLMNPFSTYFFFDVYKLNISGAWILLLIYEILKTPFHRYIDEPLFRLLHNRPTFVWAINKFGLHYKSTAGYSQVRFWWFTVCNFRLCHSSDYIFLQLFYTGFFDYLIFFSKLNVFWSIYFLKGYANWH